MSQSIASIKKICGLLEIILNWTDIFKYMEVAVKLRRKKKKDTNSHKHTHTVTETRERLQRSFLSSIQLYIYKKRR